MERQDAALAIAQLESTVGRVVRGKQDVIRLAVVSLLAGGHVLIEDVPGVARPPSPTPWRGRSACISSASSSPATSCLPTSSGCRSTASRSSASSSCRGLLFANVVLADEINRATPKTQSALLEAMSERKVTVERHRYTLPSPFLVLATQNPLEHLGTFPLPESQLDRFLMSLEMGYPPRHEERQLLLSGGVDDLVDTLPAALGPDQLQALQARSRKVKVSEKLVDYILTIAEATRRSPDYALPISTRGAQSLHRAVQAMALCEGREFAIPDDVKRLALPVLGHRVTLRRGGGLEESRAALRRLMAELPVPV